MLADVGQNVFSVLSAVGLIATPVAVVRYLLREHGRVIPWWWWIATAAALALGAGGNRGWMQGVLAVAASGMLGIGATLLALGLRKGEIRFRRPGWWEAVELRDREAGAALIWNGQIWGDFDELDKTEPYFEFETSLFNSNIHRALLDLEVRGHLSIDASGTIARPPEIVEVRSTKGTRASGPPYKGEIWIEHGEWLVVKLRQFLVVETAKALIANRGMDVWFGFATLDIGVRFSLPDKQGKSLVLGERERVPLEAVKLLIPPTEESKT